MDRPLDVLEVVGKGILRFGVAFIQLSHPESEVWLDGVVEFVVYVIGCIE